MAHKSQIKPGIRRWKLLLILLTSSVIECFGRGVSSGQYQDSTNFGDYRRRNNIHRLVPTESCYYQNYRKTLTCACPRTDSISSLEFKLGQYISRSGKDIREFHLKDCTQLYVNLDLRGVDATNVPIYFKAIQRVEFKSVSFEPKYSDRQELELNFYNVDQLLFNNLAVQGK